MPRAVAVLVVLFAFVGWAGADVLTFDDIPCNACETPIPNGYGGLNWDNFWILDAVNYGLNPSGYLNGMVSSNNVAFNAFSADAYIVSGPAFTFNSAYFTGAWNDDLTIRVQGWLDGVMLYNTSFLVDTTGPTQMFFGWTVDYLVFSSSGGTDNPDLPGSGTHFAMDNFEYNAVPEPATLVLLGTGLLGLARRLRKA